MEILGPSLYWEKYKCRTFVATKELQETDDVKCLTFYRMSKESYKEIIF